MGRRAAEALSCPVQPASGAGSAAQPVMGRPDKKIEHVKKEIGSIKFQLSNASSSIVAERNFNESCQND
jgi:hypothetical protein